MVTIPTTTILVATTLAVAQQQLLTAIATT